MVCLKSEQELFDLVNAYNWDDGFEFPETLLSHSNCSLAVALLMFDRGEGYSLLPISERMAIEREWENFIFKLYQLIANDTFPKGQLSYSPDLSRVQLYQLKKRCPNLPSVFIDGV